MLAIINAKIMTMENKTYEQGTILIKDGKILDVGEGLAVPSEAQVIDGQGRIVLPGFIDTHTHLGIAEEIYPIEGDDINESSQPITPQLRAIDAINPFDLGFKDALLGGVTTVMIAPGSANVIGGLVAVVKVQGKTYEEMVIKPEAGLKVTFGENPKRVYGHQKKMPSTRMAIASLLRQSFIEAQNYRNKKGQDRDLKYENILRVLDGEIPIRAHAHRADDILTAIRIAKEFNVRMIIEHCTEGHKIVDELVTAGYPLTVGPTLMNRSKVELAEVSYQTPVVLSKAGLQLSLITDHPVIPIQYLNISAALAVKAGMDKEKALEAITIRAAEILEVNDRIGSIKKGKDADLVIWSGDPLDIQSKPDFVLINGEIVS
ncbi:MAG: amidohydrolase [Clostridia bacterium]|jgi:imidazolonepropionase-like amidohydrolase|nr:amidohydrolase [Clostridia bacterium]